MCMIVVPCFVMCPKSGVHYRMLQEIAYDFVRSAEKYYREYCSLTQNAVAISLSSTICKSRKL